MPFLEMFLSYVPFLTPISKQMHFILMVSITYVTPKSALDQAADFLMKEGGLGIENCFELDSQ